MDMAPQKELLARAVELEGSKQAVASQLRVPESTFDRWLLGRALIPEKISQKLLELVAKHSGKASS
jgi:hypothetical protein